MKQRLNIQICGIKRAERIIGRMIVQLFAYKSVDMREQEIKKALIKLIKRSAFG